MQSKATTVEAYFKEIPKDRLAAMTKIRGLIRKAAPKAEESMQYGMPTYIRPDGVFFFALASQKGYIAVYGCGRALSAAQKKTLGKADCGKGCIRFRKPEDIPFDALEAVIKAAAKAKKKIAVLYAKMGPDALTSPEPSSRRWC